MCFNKSSSSSAQETKSTTIQRDERLAATGKSNIVSAKEGGAASLSVVNYDLSADVAADSLLYSYETTAEALGFAQGVFDAAIGAVDEVNERASHFVSDTQAQFADARETDTKQLLEQVVKIVAIGTAGLVAYQVMK